jgi:DNA polymerase-1
MLSAFNRGADIHTATASQVFEVPEEAVTSDLRKRAKAVNFGIVYGISAFSLSQDLGVSRKQADPYIKNYFAKYSGIKTYLDEVIRYAKEHGYVATPYGRRRPVPELASPKATVRAFGERVAMNSPVQGMAADVMKLAMIGVDRALTDAGLDAHLILQVHDELIVEASEADAAAAAQILQTEMERAVQLSVPLVAETAMGESWYACKS